MAMMTALLARMADGRAYSVEELAVLLNTTPDDVKRQMEFLERTGYLRRTTACGHDCSGCSAHCQGGAEAGFSGAPVFWEVRKT